MSRRLTRVVIALLVFDMLLLGALALLTGRRLLLAGAGVAGGLALIIHGLWKRHVRQLAELAAARQDLRADVQAMAEMVRRHRR